MSVSKNDTEIKKVIVTFYNLKELAAIYELSRFLLTKKMEPHKAQIGKPASGYDYDPEQVELIFKLVHLPSNIQIVKV